MLINLWYAIKKLGYMTIDNKCEYCNNTLKLFKTNKIRPNEAIVIMPHVNCSGVIVHYHIGRCDKKHIKETKIYEDMKK